MKKTRLIIVLLCMVIAVTGTYFSLNRNAISPEKIQSILITSDDLYNISHEVLPDHQEDVLFFADLVNHRKTYEKTTTEDLDLDASPHCHLTYQLSTGTLNFTLYRTDAILLLEDSDKNLYTLSDDQRSEVLVHPFLNALYMHYQAPLIKVVSGDTPLLITSSESDWQYLKADLQWYASQLPEVATAPSQPLKVTQQDTSFQWTLTPEPDEMTLQIYDEKQLCHEENVNSTSFSLYPEDGLKTYVLTAHWHASDETSYRGTASYAFDVFTDLPPTLESNSDQGQIGGFIKFTVKNVNADEVPYLEQKVLGSFQFFKKQNQYVGYMPLSYYTKPGDYKLLFSVKKDDGTESEPLELNLEVQDRDFKIQYLTISTTTEKTTRNDEAYSQFAKYFNPARESSIGEQLWEGPFIKPVEGRTSTTYGERRFVNNAPTSYRHSGMDIAISKGTPIMATNTGKVKLAMPLILTGNTIVIDHGLGIFSVYFHCNELFVEEGQMVKKGEQIATVGTTGFSTGPHLHWTMSIFDQNIDPEGIIDKEL